MTSSLCQRPSPFQFHPRAKHSFLLELLVARDFPHGRYRFPTTTGELCVDVRLNYSSAGLLRSTAGPKRQTATSRSSSPNLPRQHHTSEQPLAAVFPNRHRNRNFALSKETSLRDPAAATPHAYSARRESIVTMAWSKSSRIITMVVICTVFFFVELISGYLIHSLALLADAFHMVCLLRVFAGLSSARWKLTGRHDLA